ncbi:eCIS core domain-containing protein [Sorangium sp. So ce381]|uniref:eCIS core domain-containing protein n=1 Tax=Sorangium sp. So ce381 TaxID=3133307 RepID=UPI003F5BCE7C
MGRTAEGCPFIEAWLAYYVNASDEHLERAIRVYARPREPTLDGYLSAVDERIRLSVRRWRASGALDTPPGPGPAVPRDLATLGPGRPVASALQGDVERDLGLPLADIRVHEGPAAAAVAARHGAHALSFGSDIVLGSPPAIPRDLLLLHELAHAAQQRPSPRGASAGAAALERDADRTAMGLFGRRALSAGDASLAELHAHAEQHGVAAAALDDARASPRPRLVSPLGLHRCGGDADEEASQATATSAPPARVPDAAASQGTVGSSQGPVGSSQGPVATGTAQPAVSLPGSSAAPTPPQGLTALQSELDLVAERLDSLASERSSDAALATAITGARTELARTRTQLVGGTVDAERVRTALEILERLETIFPLLDEQERALAGRSEHLSAVSAVRASYMQALGHLFAADARATFNAAEAAAQRLPRALVNVDLDAIERHAARNREHLLPSQRLGDWVQEMRTRLDALEARRTASTSASTLASEAELVQLGLEGMEQYDRYLRAFEFMLRSRPGVLDTPTVSAMNRIRDRMEAIRLAFYAGNVADLRARVTSVREDQHLDTFYRALPGMMGTTQLIARIGVAYIAALATGGVGGIFAGGARAAATGITVRGALSFAGTVALETLVFTGVNTTLNTFLFGDRPTFGSVLRDLAWNAGLFTVLRATGAATTRGLRVAELEVLSGPVHLVTPFPILQGYGILRFRAERGRWPSRAELGQMTAENVLTMVALSVGLRVVQRWTASRPDSALRRFRDAYGLRFSGLEAVRARLQSEIAALEQRGAPDAEIEAARGRLEALEREFQALMREVQADRRFNLDDLRNELDTIRDMADATGSELLASALGIPEAVALERAGSRSHTYASGTTGLLYDALRAAGAIVTRTQDPATGLRTVEARFGSERPILFRERPAGEIRIDPTGADVQLLFTELSVTRAEAQRMLLRMMTEHLAREPTRDFAWALTQVRRQVRDLLARPGAQASAQELLLDLSRTGRLRAAADPALVTETTQLETAGILSSPEWLDARSAPQFEGVVTEWLARVRVTVPPGGRILRRIRFVGDAFIDAAGTTPFARRNGRPLVNTDITELDYAAVISRGTSIEVHTVANVKAGRTQAADAAAQNRSALAVIRGPTAAGLPQVTIDGRPAFARITRVTALDGATEVDLTGQLTEAPGGAAVEQTIGPQGGRGYTAAVPFGRSQIRDLAQLLVERQLITSGRY